jgi:hypothetical protein
MTALKVVGAIVGSIIGIVLLIALAFGLELGGLKWEEYFATKRANVRRKVFEQTKSYNEGKVQDLIRYRMQYLRAKTDTEKEVLASTIRHMFADYDENKLSVELKLFLKEIKYGKGALQ